MDHLPTLAAAEARATQGERGLGGVVGGVKACPRRAERSIASTHHWRPCTGAAGRRIRYCLVSTLVSVCTSSPPGTCLPCRSHGPTRAVRKDGAAAWHCHIGPDARCVTIV